MLLSNGAGAADVTATMSSITHHLGLRQAVVDVTFTTLTLSHQGSVDAVPVVLRRNVTHRETDYADLTAIDLLVQRVLRDEVTREEASARVAQLASSGHSRPRWSITASWGVTAAGVALMLGGDWIVLLIAAVAGSAIEVLQRRLGRVRLPYFYSQAAGGLLATLLAVLVAATPVPVDPSVVVTANIIMLLAGLGFIGAVQDALTGFYITANARVLEVIIATAGIIVGVSAGLSLGRALGVEVRMEASSGGLSDLPAVTAGAAVAAVGFAFSAYAPKRILLPIAGVAGVAGALYLALTEAGVGTGPATAVPAVLIGFTSWGVASRFGVPPLVIVVSCIMPLLPGLSIYRSLALLADDDLGGILAMITAGVVAISLSAGVLLGEYVAQPLGKEARRLEQRLAGPRLVGPLRARAHRSRRRRG